MEDLSVRRLDREEPVGTMIRRIVGDDGSILTCRRAKWTSRSTSRRLTTARTILA